MRSCIWSTGSRLIGGWQLDGLDLRDRRGGGLRVEQFRVEFTGGFVLTVTMTLRADLEPALDIFNFDSGATLVWRHDMHPATKPNTAGQHTYTSTQRRSTGLRRPG